MSMIFAIDKYSGTMAGMHCHPQANSEHNLTGNLRKKELSSNHAV